MIMFQLKQGTTSDDNKIVTKLLGRLRYHFATLGIDEFGYH